MLFRLANRATSAPEFADRLKQAGLWVSVIGEALRVVTHLDASREDIDAAIGIVREAMR